MQGSIQVKKPETNNRLLPRVVHSDVAVLIFRSWTVRKKRVSNDKENISKMKTRQENCELHSKKYLVGFTQAHKCVDILHEE